MTVRIIWDTGISRYVLMKMAKIDKFTFYRLTKQIEMKNLSQRIISGFNLHSNILTYLMILLMRSRLCTLILTIIALKTESQRYQLKLLRSKKQHRNPPSSLVRVKARQS